MKINWMICFITSFFLFFGTGLVYASNGSGSASVVVTPLTSPLVNTATNKLTFTYTAAETLSGGGISIGVPSTWSTPQGNASTAGYTTVSTTGTVGIVFDEAEAIDHWTTNGGACTPGLTIDSFHHSGSNSLKCVNNNLPSGDGPGGKFYNNLTTTQDWSQYTTVGFWIYTDTAIANGRLAFEYSTTDGLANQIETRLSLGSLVTANTWTHVFFTFTSLPAARTAVKSYGFEITNNSVKGSTIYTDGFSIGASNSSFVPGFSGNNIVVNAISLVNGNTITVTYGDSTGAGRAVAPSAPEASLFTIKSRTDESSTLTTLSDNSSPTVNVIDTTVPTVTLTAPTTGSTIQGSSVALTSTAADNVSVAGVKYYINGTLLGGEVVSPFISSFNSSSFVDGSSYSIVAVARDTSSNYATSTAATGITIDNTAPIFSSVTPANSTTINNVTSSSAVAFTTSEALGSGSITITRTSGTADATVHTCTLKGTALNSGSHTINLSDTTNGCTSNVSSLVSGAVYTFVFAGSDAFGNAATSITRTGITFDNTSPIITNVSSDKANGNYTVGEVIDIDVTFSEAVTSTGNVTVTLETGTTDRTCTFTVSNATTGTCDYTVQVGDTTSDLTVNSLSGTIKDAVLNSMTNFVPVTNLAANKAIVIDTTVSAPGTPDMTAGTDSGSSSTDNITTDTTPDFIISCETGATVTLIDGTDNTTSLGTGTCSSSAVTITSSAISGTKTIKAKQTDLAGNISSLSSGLSVTIDSTAPSITSVASTTTSVTATVTWTTTGDSSNSKVSYGTVSGAYTANSTSASFVITHSVGITGLSPSTNYFYVVVSTDTAGNIATSSEQTLLTEDVDTIPPTLTSRAIFSNNASTTLAKVGNLITLNFTSNEGIVTPVVSIAGHSVSVENTSDNNWSATYTMISGDTEGSVAFSITATDLSGNPASAVTTTTDSSAVVFDKTAPTNQDTVFASNTTKQGGASVSISSSSNIYNTVWFAPSGTTVFSPGSTMTTAGGTATTILAPSTSGSYKLFVLDAAGNISGESTATLTVDSTAPTLGTVTISSSNTTQTLAKVGDTITLIIVSSENINPPIVTIGAESGSNVTVTQGVDASHFTASATLTSSDTNGTVTFTINFTDLATNNGVQVSSVTSGSDVTFDKTSPTISSVSLSSSNSNTTYAKVGDTVTLSFTSVESISSPTVSFSSGGSPVTDTVVVNSLGNNFTATYVTNTSDIGGTITYSISSFHDTAENNGGTVTSGSGSVTFDKTRPTVILSTTASNPTSDSPIPVTVTFSESVTGFISGDVTVGNGTIQNFSGSGTTYTFDVLPTGSSVTVDVSAAVASDSSGNTSTQATQLTRTYNAPDTDGPIISGVTFSPATGALHVGDTLTINITADNSGYTAGTISINGVTPDTFVDNHNGTYTITHIVTSGESNVSQNAQIQISIILVDASNNSSAPYTTSPNFHNSPAINVNDNTKPSVTINQVGGQDDPTDTLPIAFDVVFNEAIDIDSFVVGDITQNGTASGITWEIDNSGDDTNFILRVNSISGEGTIIPSIHAGEVLDLHGNSNFASDSTDNSVGYDTSGPDTLGPEISDITPNSSSHGASIHFTTDEIASSLATIVRFGLTTSYGSTTPETNSGGSQNHAVIISGLVSCATYHYQISSTDLSLNETVSSDKTFTTRNCAGDADVGTQTAESVAMDSGGDLSLLSSGKGVSLHVPESFSGSNANFQIKKLSKSVALGAIGSPDGYQAVGDYVYDLHALSDILTAITSFDHGLTVTFNYSSDDVSNINESSLQIFRNDDGTWTPLSGCSLNSSAKTITCETENFSTFSIFGHASSQSNSSSTRQTHSNGTTVQTRVSNLISMGKKEVAEDLKKQWPKIYQNQGSVDQVNFIKSNPLLYKFTRNLKIGMTGEDVRELQKFLNKVGFTVSASGPGSSGYETNRFGQATKTALIKFQKSKGLSPSLGYFGPKTRQAVQNF
ncbi:MAG: Ig-like domain-containing protein [Patescibacteria group bacterium]